MFTVKSKKAFLAAASVLLCLLMLTAVLLSGCGQGDDPVVIGNYIVGDAEGAETTDTENTDDDGETEIKGLTIPLSDFTTTPKFYGVTVNGTYLEIIAVKYRTYYRTVFNTCQVCYDSRYGYFRASGSTLICQNCGNKYSLSEIGVTRGGCNPYPILESERVQTEDSIIIPDSFIISCLDIFKNWTGGY